MSIQSTTPQYSFDTQRFVCLVATFLLLAMTVVLPSTEATAAPAPHLEAPVAFIATQSIDGESITVDWDEDAVTSSRIGIVSAVDDRGLVPADELDPADHAIELVDYPANWKPNSITAIHESLVPRDVPLVFALAELDSTGSILAASEWSDPVVLESSVVALRAPASTCPGGGTGWCLGIPNGLDFVDWNTSSVANGVGYGDVVPAAPSGNRNVDSATGIPIGFCLDEQGNTGTPSNLVPVPDNPDWDDSQWLGLDRQSAGAFFLSTFGQPDSGWAIHPDLGFEPRGNGGLRRISDGKNYSRNVRVAAAHALLRTALYSGPGSGIGYPSPLVPLDGDTAEVEVAEIVNEIVSHVATNPALVSTGGMFPAAVTDAQQLSNQAFGYGYGSSARWTSNQVISPGSTGIIEVFVGAPNTAVRIVDPVDATATPQTNVQGGYDDGRDWRRNIPVANTSGPIFFSDDGGIVRIEVAPSDDWQFKLLIERAGGDIQLWGGATGSQVNSTYGGATTWQPLIIRGLSDPSEPLGVVAVRKLDAHTGAQVAGATVELTYADGSPVLHDHDGDFGQPNATPPVAVGPQTTPFSVDRIMIDATPGVDTILTVTETAAPAGYLLEGRTFGNITLDVDSPVGNFQLSDLPELTVSTVASDDYFVVPEGTTEVTVTDIITVGGLDVDQTAEMTLEVFGPYSFDENVVPVCEAGELVSTTTWTYIADEDPASPDVLTSPDVTLDPTPGRYVFIETTTTPDDGRMASHSCGVPEETWEQVPELTISTQVFDDLVVPLEDADGGTYSATVSDTATVTGLYETDSAEVTFELFDITDSVDAPVCSTSNLLLTDTQTITGSTSGQTVLFSPEYMVQVEPGDRLTFVASVVDATPSDDPRTATHDCGLVEETVQVKRPLAIETQASNKIAVPNDDGMVAVFDTAVIEGLYPEDVAEVTVEVYDISGSLHSPVCDVDSLIGSKTFEVIGDDQGSVTVDSPIFELPLESGVYTFVESIEDPDTDQPTATRTATHDCGEPDETFWVPELGTVLTQGDITFDGAATFVDTATIEGLPVGTAAEVTVSLFGPFSSNEEILTTDEPAEKLIETLTFSVTTDADPYVFESPVFEVPGASGIYVAQESLVILDPLSGEEVIVTHEWGDPAEIESVVSLGLLKTSNGYDNPDGWVPSVGTSAAATGQPVGGATYQLFDAADDSVIATGVTGSDGRIVWAIPASEDSRQLCTQETIAPDGWELNTHVECTEVLGTSFAAPDMSVFENPRLVPPTLPETGAAETLRMLAWGGAILLVLGVGFLALVALWRDRRADAQWRAKSPYRRFDRANNGWW